MNERIKQLAEQANIHFSRVGILDGDPNGSARLVGYSKMEKFAELIVQECLDQCYNRGMNDELYHGQLKAAAYIEEHFRVAEIY